MAHVLIVAKIILQNLWLSKVGWDEVLSLKLTERWQSFRSSLSKLEQISIPRWIGTKEANVSFISLHGFCDASERAYAAAVYLRVAEEGEDGYVSLLAAKTKIAPLKLVSVPRLEFCAAVLLTRFLVKIVEGLQFVSVPVFSWTDSAVSLAWIRGHPSRWKTFVAHRVAEIQTSLPGAQWSYVNTKLNPADAATRGISPDELMDSSLWWSGPPWLAGREEGWSCGKPESSGAEDSEMRMAVNHSATSLHNSGDVFQRFSSYLRMLNVMSLCLRWLHNFRDKIHQRSGFVSPEERAQALTAVIRSTQSTAFRDELAALTSGKSLKRSSPLLLLRPFCDADGLLRVGGRLRNAMLDYDEKHPIIIPKDHHFTVLLVRHAHAVTLHGGLQATAAYLAQRYWIIRSRVVVKREIRTCVTCALFRGETLVQRMGDLPEERVKPQRPFLSTGLDYAGPFLLRATKGRGHKAYKGYICLFIWKFIKAVELERDAVDTSDVDAHRPLGRGYRKRKAAIIDSDEERFTEKTPARIRRNFSDCDDSSPERCERRLSTITPPVFSPSQRY
ncbi:uncharacterized protein LOC124171250 [Ischnura elegans]|uniref:uncharacterized protein LOC124171250 n=1 Tax=Ischnura elegans TaxID=197161 RepID=UPI001ED8A176|nr:uncharacterized protein LOC124171250 [Ischnura elegans]